MKIVSTLAVAASLTLLSSLSTLQAQEQRREGDRGRGGFNPEDMRKRMGEYIKGALKSSDEEWTVLQPLVDKVEEKRSLTRGSFGFMSSRGPSSGGGDRPSGGDSGRSSRSGTPEAAALRDTLQKDGASNEEIASKLAAVREARKKALVELEAARGELKSLVTPRQEAVLVAFGILE